MNLRKKMTLFLSTAILLVMMGGCSQGAAPVTESLQSIDNAALESMIENQKDKPTLLVFWATWCGPCVTEIPVLNQLREEYKPEELSIIAVSVDKTPDVVTKFMEKNPMKYTVLHDKVDVAVTHGVTAIPHMEFYDRSGKKVFAQTGAFPYEMLSQMVRKLVEN
ncbi:MAG: TlpA family protein disulfide reductase [Desulfovibrio sp.]